MSIECKFNYKLVNGFNVSIYNIIDITFKAAWYDFFVITILIFFFYRNHLS